jgi:hypothetical protein
MTKLAKNVNSARYGEPDFALYPNIRKTAFS